MLHQSLFFRLRGYDLHPWPQAPARHQSAFNIRVSAGEFLSYGAILNAKDEYGAVSRFVEGARHQQLAALVRVLHLPQVFCAEWCPFRGEIVDNVVEEDEIRHAHLLKR